ncbi:hypothetical protein BA895_11635 [Humibacillus sp. DSM 29435]|uniref:hypothetical protein n=1 Tax=Humibacillus sp. DSM 29435 TaxID=1869167 RepID=UPI000871B7E4|nr:hypothetical protein [Humibacillus sp. DSM 29435]OFE14252.1 hypothetical protein BA895_11635 [Humibacillus sp. DSM 29435]
MAISIFLSRPTPHEQGQQRLLDQVSRHLERRGLAPRTIGYTDYGRHPMNDIRGVLADCNGLFALAFRRTQIIRGHDRPKNTVNKENRFASPGPIRDVWLTTPYLHIEASIAFSMGLPIVLFVEEGVRMEGALENGILTGYPPLFNCDTAQHRRDFLESEPWLQLTNSWESEVREVVRCKGRPPQLYSP